MLLSDLPMIEVSDTNGVRECSLRHPVLVDHRLHILNFSDDAHHEEHWDIYVDNVGAGEPNIDNWLRLGPVEAQCVLFHIFSLESIDDLATVR